MPKSDATGRPPKPIDIEQLEKLAQLQCTQEEIAAWFHVNRRTIIRLMKRADIRDAVERGQANGRTSLRRAQFAAALKGNATMLVWMGKQLLGQKDVVSNEHSGNVTVNDGSKDKLISKLTPILTAESDHGSDPVIN